MAIRSTSTSERHASKVSEMSTSSNKRRGEIVVSVVLVVIRRGVIEAGPHSSAAVGLGLKTLCTFPQGRYLHEVARCAENKLGVTTVT